MKKLLTIFLIGAVAANMNAQSNPTWTLRQCIDYALTHNVKIKQTEVSAKESEIDVNTNKWARLPNLSGSSSQSWNWGRAASPIDNSYSDTHSANTSFSMNSSIPLFTGFSIPNKYKLSKLQLKAALLDLQKAKEDLSINIASYYLQTLLDKELWNVAEEQVNLSQQQLNRLSRMEELGKASPAEVAEARANLEQNKLSSVQDNNSYKLSLLDLSQLMELPTPEGFEIFQPDTIMFIALTPPDEIYRVAAAIKPEIQAAQYRLDGSAISIKLARAGYMPQLSFSMGLGTNYYTLTGVDTDKFSKQIKNNLNKYIGLSLSVPIFDRFSTRNSIRTAKMEQLNLSLQLEDSKKTLYKEIQQAWYNAVASESKYKSSQTALESAKVSFQLMQGKYENGKATAVEYNESQLKLKNAESNLLQAKYDYLFRGKILDFYKGEKIK